jgi:uncharacterized iron-regulated membrane protein
VRQPQSLFLRKVLFQIHLWTGIGIGLYVLVICLTGSVLVYRNELYRTFSPQPTIVTGSGAVLTVEELARAARRAYPGYEISDVRVGETANHAIEITLKSYIVGSAKATSVVPDGMSTYCRPSSIKVVAAAPHSANPVG